MSSTFLCKQKVFLLCEISLLASTVIRGMEHLSSEDRLRVGVVQPGEEKAPGRPCSSLPVPKRQPTGKLGRDSLTGSVVIG